MLFVVEPIEEADEVFDRKHLENFVAVVFLFVLLFELLADIEMSFEECA